MKAMQLSAAAPIGRSPLSLVDVPQPQPQACQVRMKVSCCAVCRTDLHIVEGDLPLVYSPIIPGHQVVGVIDQVGPACKRLQVGQRVGIAWLRHVCGKCRFCLAGRENLCPYSQYTGYHADGGYAEYALVPEDFAYELPDAFDDQSTSPLLCAGIIGFRSLKRCNLPRGGKLAIFGFGSSAHIVMQIAHHRGHEIYVVSRSANHQSLARQLGASWCGDDASDMPSRVDGAIVFAPAGTVVPPALQCLEPGGVVALAGIHMSPIPSLDYQKYLYGERDIHPVEANTRDDARELLAEAAAVGVRPRTKPYALKDANQALAEMKAGQIDGTGVLMISN
jgi:alcohol dehydrogenase, propanol-preferring